MTIILRRMFSKKYFKPFAGVRSRMQIIKQNESDIDIEHFDSEDLSEFEADFMNVGESHKIYERYRFIMLQYIFQIELYHIFAFIFFDLL